MSNFEAGNGTIVAVTYKESVCELVSVPCEEGNRRRTNTTSTTAGPGWKLCGIVAVDWEDVFGKNGPYEQLLVAEVVDNIGPST